MENGESITDEMPSPDETPTASETPDASQDPAPTGTAEAQPAPEDSAETPAHPERLHDGTLFTWRGETVDFADFDDCKVWQEGGVQHCALAKEGKNLLDVPVGNYGEAMYVQSAFHSVRPRLHGAPGGTVVTVPFPLDRNLER